MAFPRPTLRELIDRAISDVSARTQGSAYIKKSVERVVAQVSAMLTNGLHGHLDWLQRQFFPTTAAIESLLGWGAWLKVQRKGVVAAVGQARFEGELGTEILENTQLQTTDGIFFRTTADAESVLGVITVPIVAVEAGTAGNVDAGTPVTLVTPIAGVLSAGEVSEATSGGQDVEDPDDYRVRILNNLRLPPAGGGPGDYVGWALEVPGVTRAWESGNQMGVGTVSVAFVMDDRADPIPLPGDVALVQSAIDAKRPLDVGDVFVQAPIPSVVNMTIALRPNTADAQASVLESLRSLFVNGANLGEPLPISHVTESISTSPGEEDHEVTSISSLDPSDWGLLTLGTVTFTTL